MVPGPPLSLFFSADHIIFFDAIDHPTLFSPGSCGLIIWNAEMTCVVTIVIEQCTHKSGYETMKKSYSKSFFSDLPTLRFSRCESGNAGLFLDPYCN